MTLTGDEEKPEKSPEDFPSLPPDEPLDPKYVGVKCKVLMTYDCLPGTLTVLTC